MSLSESMLTAAQPYLVANQQHPFVQGIIHGTLTPAQLHYYDQQDLLFEYNEIALIDELISCSTTTAQVTLFQKRLALQLDYLLPWLQRDEPDMPHDWASLKQTPVQPMNQLYQQHMTGTLHSHCVLQILPAFAAGEWLYVALGEYAKTQVRDESAAYRNLLTFDSAAFHGPDGYLQQFWQIIDQEAATATPAEQAQAKQTFLKSCLLEWYFWEAAFKCETWADWQRRVLG